MKLEFSVLNTEYVFHNPAGYKMEVSQKLGWFKRKFAGFARRWLKNNGCLEQYALKTPVYTWGKDQEEQIFPKVQNGIERIVCRDEDPDNYALVCGAKTFSDLTEAPLINYHAAIFNGPKVTYGYKGMVYGLPVHVVPELEGVALIPKVVIERAEK